MSNQFPYGFPQYDPFRHLGQRRPVGARETAALLDLLLSDKNDIEVFAKTAKALIQVFVDNGDKEGAALIHTAAIGLIERNQAVMAAEEEAAKDGGKTVDKADTAGLIIYKPEDYEEGSYIPEPRVGEMLDRLVVDMKNATRYRDLGIDVPNRVFFVGPPGTGKTAASWYLAHRLGRPLVVAPLDAIKSRFVGQTQRNIAAAAEVAKSNGNAVLFLDEADTLFPRRDKVTMSDEGQNTTGAFLQRSSILSKDCPDLLIVLASNLAELIDPALRGRITTHIPFENPSAETRTKILAHIWRKLGVDDDARQFVVERTAERSGRYLHLLAHDTARFAIGDTDAEQPRITIAHARKASLAAAPHEDLGKPKVALR